MMQWIMMFENARGTEKPGHELADPLEGEDWRGLAWLVNLFTAVVRFRSHETTRPRTRQVHRWPSRTMP